MCPPSLSMRKWIWTFKGAFNIIQVTNFSEPKSNKPGPRYFSLVPPGCGAPTSFQSRYFSIGISPKIFPKVFPEVFLQRYCPRYFTRYLSWGISPKVFPKVFPEVFLLRYFSQGISQGILWGICPEVFLPRYFPRHIPRYFCQGVSPQILLPCAPWVWCPDLPSVCCRLCRGENILPSLAESEMCTAYWHRYKDRTQNKMERENDTKL